MLIKDQSRFKRIFWPTVALVMIATGIGLTGACSLWVYMRFKEPNVIVMPLRMQVSCKDA